MCFRLCVCCKMIRRITGQTSSCVPGSDPADGVWSSRKGHVYVFACVHMSGPLNALCVNSVSVYASKYMRTCLCRLPRGHWKMTLLKISRAVLTGPVNHRHSSAIFPQQSHNSTWPRIFLSRSLSLHMSFDHLCKFWGGNQTAPANAK